MFMKRFFTWLYRKGKKAHELTVKESEDDDILEDHSTFRSRGIDFTLYRATGGYVIEYHYYDDVKETSYDSLHVITEDKDLGEAISKILTFESLRK